MLGDDDAKFYLYIDCKQENAVLDGKPDKLKHKCFAGLKHQCFAAQPGFVIQTLYA